MQQHYFARLINRLYTFCAYTAFALHSSIKRLLPFPRKRHPGQMLDASSPCSAMEEQHPWLTKTPALSQPLAARLHPNSLAADD